MLNEPKFRRYVWAPILINLLIYGFGAWAVSHYFGLAMDGLIPAWLDWLRWLLWPLFALVLFVLAFFSFTLIANLIGAPFYGVLARRVHEEITGRQPAASDASWLRELTRGVGSEAGRMAYIASRALMLLPTFLVPVLNILSSAIWLLFGAWGLALEYYAYPLELRGLSFADQRNLARRNRIDTLAFGGAVMLGLSIPILNIFIPPAAVIGATLYLNRTDERA
ncbi:sulfate transporter CysZ [Methylococcus sp. EFPC2]|uniref:sulfate transporter CysZ n=1 Tax=Methylococcus sp. EFPC2 TaxID=2812648 RepID=UPI001967267F|nr:sulfate transporter CysZ [Methylococcus sp. EFPC2]QSA98680.1 sulfate transporter CysZ [Methylococcus sp. EFPC2]